MRPKTGIILIAVGILVLITGFFFYAKGGLDFMDYLYAVLIMLLLIGSIILGIRYTKSMKKGLPVKDELAQKIAWKSGYYTYMFSVWFAVALLWYSTFFVDKFSLPSIDSEQIIGLFVLVPGVIFLGLTFYLDKRGDI